MGVVVAYYGGRVLSNVAIVAVFWTSNVDIDLQQEVGDFYTAIAASSYVDWLEEYDTLGRAGVGGQPGSEQHIGRGSLAGVVTITPSTQSTALDDGVIASELAAQIAAGSLPAPTVDAAGNVNTVYMIEVPPGYTVTRLGGVSCTDFCGYHSTVSIGGKSVPYAVLPDSHACIGAVCGQGFDDETILRSHELAEAITDTESGLVSAADVDAGNGVYPMAWAGDGGTRGEIGDLCFHGFVDDNDQVAGYQVQKLWSNLAGACVVGIPICTPGTTPPACRPCEGVECAPVDAGSGADAGARGAPDADADASVGADAGPDGGRVRAGCSAAGAGVAGVDAWAVVAALSASLGTARRARRRARWRRGA
jgi:hypothetical protein